MRSITTSLALMGVLKYSRWTPISRTKQQQSQSGCLVYHESVQATTLKYVVVTSRVRPSVNILLVTTSVTSVRFYFVSDLCVSCVVCNEVDTVHTGRCFGVVVLTSSQPR